MLFALYNKLFMYINRTSLTVSHSRQNMTTKQWIVRPLNLLNMLILILHL